MRRAWVILAVLAALLPMAKVQAQTGGQVVYYPAGWSMVGAPPGTSFASAGTLDIYNGSGYSAASSSTATLCAGMWAYFPKGTSVPFTSMPPLAAVITCSLRAGWTLVSNPFINGAILSGGATGYLWDPAEGMYVTVTEIPLGAAVWIYSESGGSVSLQIPPNTAPVATISPQPSTARQQLRVGDTIELVASGQFPVIVSADPRYLILEGSGTSGTSTTWRFRAIAAGSTDIIVSPACAQFGCLAPSWLIGIDILPATAGATLTIMPPIAATPYQAHVGDTVDLQLLLLGPGVFSATFDPSHLQLVSATARSAEPVHYDWRWLAIAPGGTTIVIDMHYPDMPSQYVITIDISP